MPNLQVIAIPCNQFGAQEPGTPEEIKAYVFGEVERGRGGALSGKLKGLPNFTLLEKSTINGNGMHPIFKLAKQKFPGETNCEPEYHADVLIMRLKVARVLHRELQRHANLRRKRCAAGATRRRHTRAIGRAHA